jgi:hypothetical protein
MFGRTPWLCFAAPKAKVTKVHERIKEKSSGIFILLVVRNFISFKVYFCALKWWLFCVVRMTHFKNVFGRIQGMTPTDQTCFSAVGGESGFFLRRFP